VGVAEALPADPGAWPWATLLVNVAGAFVLGATVPRARWRPLVGTGFCGALTTFSTLQVEVLGLLDAGRVALAALYVGISGAAGLAAVALGERTART
jgi:fluoride exporter